MNTSAIKQKLEEEKKALMEELKGLGRIVDTATGEWGAVPEDGGREADQNDLADKYEDFEQKTSLLKPILSRFKEVTTALKNIEHGSYGKCVQCGNAIESDRLSANPAASTCKKHMN